MRFTRITINPHQMGGVPCIRGLRIPVSAVVGMVADRMTEEEILAAYPDLEREDIYEARHYTAETVQLPRFDNIVRSERYFTATLLPVILFHDDFRGLEKFSGLLCSKAKTERDGCSNCLPFQGHVYSVGDIKWGSSEIITEFHIARDLRFAGKLPEVEQQETEDAPDLVLVLGERAIVCEGKFFVKYTLEKLNLQLLSQRQQVRHLFEARPQLQSYLHVALLPADPGVSIGCDDAELKCDAVVTWTEVAELSRQVLGADHYVTKRLDHSIRWYEQLHGDTDVDTGTPNYDGKLWLDDVLDLCRKRGDEVHVGHRGGETGVKQEDPEYLKNKFWKWRDPRTNQGVADKKNWIPGERFLAIVEAARPGGSSENRERTRGHG